MTASWTEVARAAGPAVRLVEEIGCDRALTPGDLSAAVRTDVEVLRACWAAYERQWARFCGARLDPQFSRLSHPAAWSGVPVVGDDTPVVVVGTGPSLTAALPVLSRVRPHVHLFTSPRGADALSDAGLQPDVVVVEHQTPLDAQFSVQALAERTHPWRDHALIVTDERTPAVLLDGIAADRLLVLDPLPTWGLWPGTAVATALLAGAVTVALLGVDLGTPAIADLRQQPLSELLGLLALRTPTRCVDVGHAGAAKPGWQVAPLDDIVGSGRRRPLAVARLPWPAVGERLARADAARRRLAPLVSQAGAALDAAIRVRDGDRSADRCLAMMAALETLLESGFDPETRDDVQTGLGCGYLPRYWRTPPDRALGPLLWRPLALCAHEVIAQHRALVVQLRRYGVSA